MARLSFQIEIPEAQLKAAQRLLDPKQVIKAARSAANDAARAGATAISRLVRAELNVSAAAVKENVIVKPASRDSFEASVTVKRKAVPLIDYKPRQTKRGVSVRVRKTQPIERLRGVFIATMKSGHRGAFERRRLASGRRVARLPIEEKRGPTIVGVFANKPGILEAAVREISQRYQERFQSKLEFQLRGGSLGAS